MMVQKRKYTRGFLWSKAIVVIALLMLLSCRKTEETGGSQLQQFMEMKESGLWGYGGYLFKYSQRNCQFSINPMRRQIRMQEDGQLYYVNIQFAAFPPASEGEIELQLTYRLGNEENSRKCIMTAQKCEEYRLWLWDAQNDLGVIIPYEWESVK